MWSNRLDHLHFTLLRFTIYLYRLAGCDLNKTDWEAVAAALSSNPSHLTELDLTGTKLDHSAMELISAALESPHCRLQTLRSD